VASSLIALYQACCRNDAGPLQQLRQRHAAGGSSAAASRSAGVSLLPTKQTQQKKLCNPTQGSSKCPSIQQCIQTCTSSQSYHALQLGGPRCP
jgi:hypothetical protein